MRVPYIFLFVLAIAVVSSSGCKVRGKNGLSAKRPVSRGLFRSSRDRSLTNIGSSLATRGTAECDCYTCRLERQQPEADMVEFDFDAMEPATEAFEQSISTYDNSYIQPEIATPDSKPAVQEIQGRLIQDFELTNELPAEPDPMVVPEIPSLPEIQPDVDIPQLQLSPETGMNSNIQQEHETAGVRSTPIPMVQSAPIKAKTVSARLNKETPSVERPSEEQPVVNGSAFRLGTHDNSVLEVDKPKAQRDETIWFAPGKEPTREPTPARPQPSPSVVPREASAPVIEHEIKQITPIVLTARPVDRHMLYNSRQPTHAPIREARLTTDSRFVPPHQRTRNSQLHFHPLPPQQPTPVSPAQITPAPLAPVPQVHPLVNPQSSSPLFSPVPQQEEESAELRLRASVAPVAPTGDQRSGSRLLEAPMAHVIPKSSPILKLNAAPTSDQPQLLPTIAKIHGRSQGRVIVGSLQSPQEATQQNSTPGMNRLHTTPWQPMETGKDGSRQVQRSIRQLMIQPQQEANFGIDGIHR